MGAKSGQKKKSAGAGSKGAGAKRLALVLFGAVFVLLFVGFAIAEGIGKPSVAAGDVALVQNVPTEFGHISEKEFDRALDQQVASGGLKKTPKPGSKKYEELKTAVMGELVEAAWLTGEAEEMGISVTEKQIETELANIKKQNFPTEKAYQEFLKSSHYTQEDVDRKVELQILGNKVQEKVTNEAQPASNSEIQDYYEAEKATQFTEPPSRDVRVIVNEDKAEVEKAQEALAADNSPASWKKAAKKYSSDPTTSSKGGLQESIPEELLQGPLKKAIYESSVGELVGPTKYQGNYLLTEVVKLNPEKVKSLGEVRSQISQTLTQQKQSSHFEEWFAGYRSKWISRSFCAAGFEVEQCSNYPASKRLEKSREAYKSCFEANPKTPPTECPAAVEQTKPALPGTVSVTKPAGEAFVQRPRPSAAASAAGAEGAEAAEGAAGAEGGEAASGEGSEAAGAETGE